MGSLAAALLVGLLVGVGPVAPASAAICTVPGTHPTIQSAVNDPNCDTINVSPGVYPENVTVNRPVLLRGAQAGNDARTGRTNPLAESIVAGPSSSFLITANNVTIDGFTVEGAVSILNAGIYVSPSISGTRILNNIIRNNIIGVYLNSSGSTETVVRFNRFENNNQPGPASGNGIYSEILRNAQIDSNSFAGHQTAAMTLVVGPISDLDITNNQSTGDGNLVLIYNATNATIGGNRVTNPLRHGIQVEGGSGGLTIAENTITGAPGGFGAIHIGTTYAGPSSNISVLSNALVGNGFGIQVGTGGGPNALTDTLEAHFNRIVGNAGAGLRTEDTSAVDAENNWWGCNEGPAGPDCNDAVGANVDFDPWLVLTVSAAEATILPGGQTTVTASLTTNSAGQDTSGAGTVPDGTPVQFATTRGAVSPTTTATTDGRATTTHTAPTTNGAPAIITATVDQETVGVQVSQNVAPVANSDSFTTAEDTPLTVPAPGVLANDSDANADPLTAVLGTGPSNGTLTLNPNGSFTYTPNANFNGLDSFTYRASDGVLTSNLATVTITVTPVNDPPTISDIPNQTIPEDTSTGPLAFTVGDADGVGTVTVTATSNNQALVPNGSISIGGSGANRTVTVTPAPDANGVATITVTATDDAGATATDTFTVTVTDVPEAPPPAAPGQFTLTVQIARVNNGNGTVGAVVAGRPGGVSCPPDCAEAYGEGTLVTLIATPARDSFFTGWSGGGCTGTGPCVVTLSQARTVTATFTRPTCQTPDGRRLNATIAGPPGGAPTGRRTILGTRNADVIVGSDLGEVIFGFGGDDVICAAGGNDRVFSGAGNDTVDAGAGIDSVDAGPGNDVVNGGAGDDELRGREGADTLRGGPGNDVLGGGPGADRLFGDAGNDRILGEQGDDQIQGGEDTDNCFRGPTRFSNTAGGCEAVGDEP